LEPLGPDEAELMIASLANLDEGLRQRIREAAEGNPLFVEQMVALAQESGDGNVTVPPTIQALLAARIDQLDASERGVLERGSVEGRVFHRGAVQALAPEEGQVMARLNSLVRKELVRPDKAQLAGEEAFRFRHLLIRDAAYDALPKAMRAELHERFAAWLEVHAVDLVELDEILGYHLEQAYSYRMQLGAADERGSRLALQAAERLADAGKRAFVRGDMSAAVHLLERAATLPPSEDLQRLRLLPSLGRALIEIGDWARAEAVLSEAVVAGRTVGEHGVAADATVALAIVQISTDPESRYAQVLEGLAAASSVFEHAGDKAGLARAVSMTGLLHFVGGAAAVGIEELERATRYAREAGDLAQEMESLGLILIATMHGPTPVASGLAKVEEVRRRTEGALTVQATILRIRAHLEAMRGQLSAARNLIAEAKAVAQALGLETTLASGILRSAGEIELLAGDHRAAEGAFRTACETLERKGDLGSFASLTPLLADALNAQGRGDEAAPWIELATRGVSADDSDAQIGLLRVRARLLAQQGALKEAERLAHQATDLAAQTDLLNNHAKALSDLADVLELAGRREHAAAAVQTALALYERKGNLVMAERANARLTKLHNSGQ
jgi:tetratricopeptide (TPR) repeat protein